MSENRFLPTKGGKLIPQSVVMYVGGTKSAFHGWEDLTINKKLESLATSFKFKIPQKFRDQLQEFKLAPGVRVQINVNNEPVITGRIENLVSQLTKDENSLEISGRSLTGDLVDCSVVGPMEYQNISLDKLARELVKPFGTKVFLSAEPKVITKVSIKPGDTVFEVLDKYARLQGLFWVTTREGNLRLAFAGNSRADSRIEEDVNMLQGSVNLDESQRFSRYIVKGQTNADDNFPGVLSSVPMGEATDLGISRSRPLMIIAEGAADSAICKTRAQWEACTRLAKALNIRVTVQGWQQETGILWGLNQLTVLKAPTLGIDGTFLTNEIEHKRSESEGTITSIGLTLKDAYKTAPSIPKKATNDLEAIVNFSKKNPKAVQ